MAIIGANNYSYKNYIQNNVNKAQQTNETEIEKESMTADEFLEELKKEFPDVNIYAGRIVDSNKNHFAAGPGLNNIFVSKRYLEEMASNPKKREEFKQRVSEMKDAVDLHVRSWKSRNRELYQFGYTIDNKGKMSSWSNVRVLDYAEENRRKKAMQNNTSYVDRLKEQRKLDEEYREKKRLEKKELEKREQKKLEAKRLEEKLEQKRLEQKRQLEGIIN